MPDATDIFLVFKEVPPDGRYLQEGDVHFIACFDREDRPRQDYKTPVRL